MSSAAFSAVLAACEMLGKAMGEETAMVREREGGRGGEEVVERKKK